MNVYNDFHSRGGAPDAQPFYTLKEHEERLEAKLHALEEASKGAAASADTHEKSDADDAGGVRPGTSQRTSPQPTASSAPVQHVRQHLVMQRWQPEVSEELDMFDKNLAGKRLLSYLDPFD